MARRLGSVFAGVNVRTTQLAWRLGRRQILRADGEQIITLAESGVQPAMQPLTNADTPADGFLASAYDTANYASSAGTIVSAVRQVSINGSAWTTTLDQDILVGDVVSGRILVTDSEGNTRNFGAGSVTVPALAIPANDTPGAITGTLNVGQTLTMSNGAWTPTAGAFQYRWLQGAMEIEDADGATYLISPSDDETTITGQHRAAVVSDGETGEYSAWVDATGGGAVTYAAPVAAGALPDATYDLDSGDKTIDFASDFTSAAGGVWSITGVGATIAQTGIATITTAALRTASPVAATYTNSGGADTSTVNVTVQDAPSAINPTALTVDFQQPGGGAPQRLDTTHSYTGGDTRQLVKAYRNGGTALTSTQLLNNTGTFIFRQVVSPLTDGSVTIDEFTGWADATHVDVIVAEVNNGGVSSVVTEAVTLDFATETRSSVATNTAGSEVTVTWSGTLFDPAGTLSAANFSMTGHTISAAVLSGATVVLSITPSVAPGDSDTLDYSGTALVDANGNTVATFSGVAVTNNVPAAGPYVDAFTGTNGDLLSARTGWTLVFDELGGGTREFQIQGNAIRAEVLSSAAANTITYDFDEVLGNDQYAQVTLTAVGGPLSNNQQLFNLYVRRSGSTGDGNGYRAAFNITTGNITVSSRTNGAGSSIISGSHTFATGNKYKLEANGTTIRVLIDTGSGFTEALSVTNSDHSSGKAGIGNRQAHAGSLASVTLDDWEAGNL